MELEQVQSLLGHGRWWTGALRPSGVSGPNRLRAEATSGFSRLAVSPYWARARSQWNLKKKEENGLGNIHLNPIQSSSYLSWLLVFHYFPLHIIQLRTPSDLTTDFPIRDFSTKFTSKAIHLPLISSTFIGLWKPKPWRVWLTLNGLHLISFV